MPEKGGWVLRTGGALALLARAGLTLSPSVPTGSVS